jgi:hypothetical protein
MVNAICQQAVMTDQQQQAFMVADTAQLSSVDLAKLQRLPEFGDAFLIGDVPHQLAIPVAIEDEDIMRELLAAGTASYIVTSLAPKVFADRLGVLHYYFHPHTGRLNSYSLCIPMILAFFLANAGPALAQHVMQGMQAVVAKGYAETVWQAEVIETRFQFRLISPDAQALPDDIILPVEQRQPIQDIADPSDWVRNACVLQPTAQAAQDSGSFPELTPEFITAFETFQRRLCVRQLVEQERNYLAEPFTTDLEDRLLVTARHCGYWQDLPFSSFAYAFLILGQDSLLNDQPNFKCNTQADPHPLQAFLDIDMVRMDAGNRRQNLALYGPDWGKE